MSGIGWVRLHVTVPVALGSAANATAEGLDFDAGADTFEVPLAPPGATEPTDLGASTLVRPHTAETIVTELLPAFAGARVYSELGGWTWRSALEDAGLQVLEG